MTTRFVRTPAFGAFEGLALMDDALRSLGAFRNEPFTRAAAWTSGPEFASSSDDDGWTLTADVAGLAAENLEIEAHDGRLTVRAKRTLEAPEGFRAVRRERRAQAFEQRFELGKIDADHIEAKLSDGVLTIRIPKAAEAKPRTISITTG